MLHRLGSGVSPRSAEIIAVQHQGRFGDSDLNLDEGTQAKVRERCDELIEYNAACAWESLAFLGGAFARLYNHHKDYVNATSDGLKVFFWCHAVNDSNVRKLVRSKVLSIFKPSFR